MIVVSDTSPITALLKVGRIELLHSLFGRVIIPPAVEFELLRDHSILPAWLEVIEPRQIPWEVAAARLDAGETQALALALELKAGTVLIDERLGRRVALRAGLPVIGMLGCLLLAKREGHIAAVAPVIDELRRKAGCWFDDALIATVLSAAGEG